MTTTSYDMIPIGHIDYRVPSQLFISGEVHQVYQMLMLCGGTGITPMYQVLKAVLLNPLDTVKGHMIFANRTEEDILLKEILLSGKEILWKI